MNSYLSKLSISLKVVIFLIFLFTCLVFCSPVKSPDKEMIFHWARSDDLSEYNGLYVYSLEKSGDLVMTNYPSDKFDHFEKTQCIGYWAMSGDTLIWKDKEKKNSIAYIMGKDRIYWEKDSKYYVPVKLVPVIFKNNIPVVNQ